MVNIKAHAIMAAAPSVAVLAEYEDDFLRTLFCSSGSACGKCPGCKKAISREHTDLLYIDGTEGIKIGMVRPGVTEFASKRSFEGGAKAIVLHLADEMTVEAQNSLLKALEEPPENTYFLLTVRSEARMLETVLSRCAKERIAPDGRAAAAAALREMGADGPTAMAYAALAEGYTAWARELYGDEAFAKRRQDAISCVERLCRADKAAVSTPAGILGASADVAESLELMQTLFADMLDLRTGAPESALINADCLHIIKTYGPRFTPAALCNIIDILGSSAMEKRECKGMLVAPMLMRTLFDVMEVKLNGSCNNRHTL